MEEVAARVIKIVAEKLGKNEVDIKSESRFTKDLGADSLDSVEIIMEIEREFNVSVPDDVAESIETIEDVVNFVKETKGL